MNNVSLLAQLRKKYRGEELKKVFDELRVKSKFNHTVRRYDQRVVEGILAAVPKVIPLESLDEPYARLNEKQYQLIESISKIPTCKSCYNIERFREVGIIANRAKAFIDA